MTEDNTISPDNAPPNNPPPRVEPPPVHLRPRNFSFVWLIPIIAAVIALYLGYRTLIQEGPLLTLTFSNGEGMTTGQTQIKYKAVALGTVESIDLSPDHSKVVVKVRMNNVGARFLTSNARFWVVRPHFTPSDFSGLDTLVSGAYIAVDPGQPGGKYQDSFTGLEEPPGVRSDEPGQTYLLKTNTLGQLSAGSPVFYRDIVVGEVLGYDVGDGLGPITVSIFVRAPFDGLIRPDSHFWKSSGITAGLQNGGFHVEFQSLQAIISGGVTFDVPRNVKGSKPSPDYASFPLYNSADDAFSAGYQPQIPLVSYFTSSVAGLAKGAPVNVLGIQVGVVTGVQLIVDPVGGSAKARVTMALQPSRVLQSSDFAKNMTPEQVLQNMVNKGLRVELETASYVTGQEDISLTFVPNAGPATILHEGNALVMPNQPSSLGNLLNSATTITTAVSKIPFEQIGENFNKLLVTANGTLGSKQLKQTLTSLSDTLKTADNTLNGVNQGYGNDSNFQRNLEQLISQANDALRSIKELADMLNRHPQALLLGRSGQ